MKMFDLRPVDNRKSFYGKCSVIEKNGAYFLRSYNTIVCGLSKSGKFSRYWGGYSATTQRHIDSFCAYFNIAGGGKKWWEGQPVRALRATL